MAQRALVRAGMSPEASKQELDLYIVEIQASQASTADVLKAGFMAGFGVVIAGLVLFVSAIVLTGLVEVVLGFNGSG